MPVLAEVPAGAAGEYMIPVTVRLANSKIDRHITKRISGLNFRSVVPGGFAVASFQLHSPITVNDPLLAPFTRVYIYDGRNGNTLWEGRLALPGKAAGENGQIWALTAAGPSAHTNDEKKPLIYLDTRLDQWERSILETSMPASSSVSVGNHPNTTVFDCVICQAGPGVPVTDSPQSKIAATYDGFVGSGMEIGAIGYSWDAGFTSLQWDIQAVLGPYPTYTTIIGSVSANVAGGTFTGWVIDDFPAGRDICTLRMVRVSGGAATVAGDTTWATFANIRILGRRIDQNGDLIDGFEMSSSIFVRASWIVADLLGRMLPQYDGVNAILTGDTVDIDQLAYNDPVTPAQVLDDLMALEPSTYWAAWESNPSNGLYRFEWSTWPTTVRYEASVGDGFDSPSPTFELYDRVRVRWRDSRGRIKWTTQVQTVRELTDEGLTREGYVDLGEEAGSTANAVAAGWAFLLDHRSPSSSGTLTVSRPIRDIASARMVMPWEIRPGQLIRVRGVEASRALDDETRDGQTIFRIVAVDVDSEGHAKLELDMFQQTEQRALASLAKRRQRRR